MEPPLKASEAGSDEVYGKKTVFAFPKNSPSAFTPERILAATSLIKEVEGGGGGGGGGEPHRYMAPFCPMT